MKYEVYTDGACNPTKNKLASAYMIRTERFFVSQAAKCFEGDSIAVAESLAVGIAVEHLLKELKLDREHDTVIIRTDSESVIKFFAKVKEEGSRANTGDPRVKLVWDNLKKLTELCEWKFIKVDAHVNEINGNKVADRLAKYVLRLACE